ncbi:MAG: DUF4097 domain-containing protein [Treponema sp.]|nr:DUF4097 domain-containing protein [Treponema sp.]
MKKNHVLGFIWVIVAVFIAAFLIMELTSFSIGGNIKGWIERHVPRDLKVSDEISFSSQKNALPADGVKIINAELIFLPLEIQKSEDNDIHIDFLNGAEEKCTFAKSEGRIVIQEKRLKGKKDYGVLLKIPSSFTGILNLESNGGGIKVSGIKLPELDIENISGSINVTDCEFEGLNVETVSGSLHADGNFEQIDIEAVSGSVEISTLCALKRKSSLESVSGSIVLELPEDSDYCMTFECVGGKFTDNITGMQDAKNGTSENGKGSVLVSVSSVSGSVKVSPSKVVL